MGYRFNNLRWPRLGLSMLGMLVAVMWTSGCREEFDREEAKRQIMAIHRELIAAHQEKDPGFFTRGLADGFLAVKNGEILQPTATEIRFDVEPYLREMEFHEYRDLREPIIGFSQDGSLAWVVVQVKVRGTRTRQDGMTREINFVCAWLTLYERSDEGWMALAEVSTFR
jgi:hypothetical protein